MNTAKAQETASTPTLEASGFQTYRSMPANINGANQCFNEAFAADVMQHKINSIEGGLGEWFYSDPAFDGDPVHGASLWVDFIRDAPEYYIPNAEIKLAERASKVIPDIIEQPVILCFLGIGNGDIFKQKDIKLTEKFKNVSGATTYDLSTLYVQQSLRVMEESLPSHTVKSGTIVDMFKGFPVTRNASDKRSKVVASMFGGTLLNTTVERDGLGDLIVPEKPIRENLKAIRGSLSKGDFFIVTQDANTNKKKIEAAYAKQGEFAGNLAHRIKRDMPMYPHIDTEHTPFRVEFDENSGILAHYLTLNFNNGDNGPREYLVNSSPKIPEDEYKSWCKKEKFNTVHTIKQNGVLLHVLQAI